MGNPLRWSSFRWAACNGKHIDAGKIFSPEQTLEHHLMRYVVCIVLGLLIGAIAAVTATNILASQRDPYPDSLMQVMSHELGAAKKAAELPACNDNRYALDKLSMLSDDIIIAMPDSGEPDRVFHQYITNLHDKVEIARQAECVNRKQALVDVKNACSDCHRDYR